MIADAATLLYETPAHVRHVEKAGAGDDMLQLFEIVSAIVDAGTAEYTTVLPGDNFAPHFSKLKDIETDSSLWPEGAEAPSREALAWAASVLAHLKRQAVLPARVVASAEGGVAICFVNGEKYSDIECLNNGAILGITFDGRDRPSVWEIKPESFEIAGATDRIRRFLIEPASSEDVRKR